MKLNEIRMAVLAGIATNIVKNVVAEGTTVKNFKNGVSAKIADASKNVTLTHPKMGTKSFKFLDRNQKYDTGLTGGKGLMGINDLVKAFADGDLGKGDSAHTTFKGSDSSKPSATATYGGPSKTVNFKNGVVAKIATKTKNATLTHPKHGTKSFKFVDRNQQYDTGKVGSGLMGLNDLVKAFAAGKF